jgi:isopentenyl diphosphate isomerase/L-lactate dehydrogenase-like FMN-dependent dehydrogenase
MSGLCVTVDGVGAAMRERDVVNRLASPPTLTLRNAHDMLRRPRWLADVVRHRRTGVRMEPDSRGPRLRDMVGAGALMAERAQRFPVAPMTWDDLVWLRETWSGALAVKGVLDPEDARRAVATGADAIVVSSHGGRALDGVPTALEALPAVAAAVGDEADVILDGGVRRGTDVLKALCLGARACMVGRAWAYALGAAGEPGVSDMLDLLHAELLAGMRSLGRTSVDQLSPAVVRRAA